MKTAISRAVRRAHRSSVHRSARRVVEQLEERRLLTTTLYLDFGIGIGVGNTLNTTVAAFRGIFGADTGTNMGDDSDGNPSPFADEDNMIFSPLAYDFDGDSDTDNADLTALANAALPAVQRALEPFDIDIVLASATSLADAVTTVGNNAGDADGEFDAYVFIVQVTNGSVGVPSGLFGSAAVTDLGGGTGNTADEASLTFADNVFGSTPGTQGTAAFNANLAQRLAYTATHEGFHTFAYRHTPDESGGSATANQFLLASGDVIRRGSNTRDFPFIVTRFDLPHTGGPAELNNYLFAANDADIGLRDTDGNGVPDLAYSTGTGAHDIISFADAGGGIVDVDVEAYSNAARTNLISSEAYSIDLATDTEGEILVDASINADEVRVDASIATNFRLRGGTGLDGITTEADLLTFLSGGLSGTWTPGPDGINGTVTYAGGFIATFTEFEDVEAAGIPIEITSLTFSTFSLNEGGTLNLSGEFINIDTLDTHTVTIDWGDGSTPTVLNLSAGDRDFATSHVFADDNPTGTSSDDYTVTVTIEDEDGDTGTDGDDVTVNNVDPVITAFGSDATFEDKGEEGEPVNITGTFTDVGVADTHSAVVDWGDGSSTEPVTVVQGAGSGSISGSHVYAGGGIYTVTVTLTDDDTGTDTSVTTVVITGVGLNFGTLFIIGSANADDAGVLAVGGNTVRVMASFIDEDFRDFTLADIDEVISWLCDGDDFISVASNFSLPTVIHGGDGNDELHGGRGAVLIGDAGNDTLIAQSGRDVLIGGTGSDRLVGANGDDILIGGTTDIDADDAALLELLAAWSDTSASYASRVTTVTGLFNTVDDGDVDVMTGSAGTDLFFDGVGDVIEDAKGNEDVL